MIVALLAVAGIVLWWLLQLACNGATATLAGRLGIAVEEVVIGAGPTLATWRHGGAVWKFKLLPLSGSVRFRDSFDAAGTPAALLGRRFALAAVGPLIAVVTGAGLLGAAVIAAEPQIRAGAAERPEAPPPLIVGDQAATCAGQFRLAFDLAGPCVIRLLTFRALDGWGGCVAFLVASARLGEASLWNWTTLLGIASVSLGCVGLLPIPTQNGFRMLLCVASAILGRRLPERAVLFATMAGVLYMIAVFLRLVWLDAWWLWGNLAS